MTMVKQKTTSNSIKKSSKNDQKIKEIVGKSSKIAKNLAKK